MMNIQTLEIKRLAGFTLIEIMIVVAIIGILTAIALPNYAYYVLRSRIPDATSNLATKRIQNEQYFQDNRTYVGAPGCTADSTSSQNFDFSCTEETATDYKIVATGKGKMIGFAYSIDEDNAKATTGVGSGWSSSATCWVIQKDGSC